MIARRLAAALLAIAVHGVLAGAQGAIGVGLPLENDSIPAAPLITATAFGVPLDRCPCVIALEVAATPQFDLLLASSSREGTAANFTLSHILPEKTRIFMRVRLFDRFGTVQAEAIAQGVTRSRLRLVSPITFNQPLFTRTPTFTWSSSSVTQPPGHWEYELTVTNTATQIAAYSVGGLTDTVHTVTTPLEANTSYRWQVRARIPGGLPGDQALAASAASFVISSADAPVTTLLYNAFPNPFPQPWSGTTCIWFDLAVESRIRLAIVDIQQHLVRTIFNGTLGPGAHGRFGTSPSSCDSRFSWDGTDNRGRVVPAGAYLLIFESDADRVRRSVKILFTGR
jgi:hypothetical protein